MHRGFSQLSPTSRSSGMTSVDSAYSAGSVSSGDSMGSADSTGSADSLSSASAMFRKKIATPPQSQRAVEKTARGLTPAFYDFVRKASILDVHAETLADALARASGADISHSQQTLRMYSPHLRSAAMLLQSAAADVYIAENRPYVYEALRGEYPELDLFRLNIEDAFVASEACPGFWVETERFADLRCLAPLRRELRKSDANAKAATNVVGVLLGLVDG